MKATTQKEFGEKIFTDLESAGFSHQELDIDDGFDVPVNEIHNELGVYIGDILEAKGFIKSEEVERGKTWTTFKHGDLVISHRSFSEMPDAHAWSINLW